MFSRKFWFAWTMIWMSALAVCSARIETPPNTAPDAAPNTPAPADGTQGALLAPRILEAGADAAGAFGKMDDNFLVAIGVTRFDDESVAPLQFCDNDARAIHDFFTANGLVKESHAYTLATGSSDPNSLPTRNNILATIQHVVDNSTPDSTIILLFSGHGFADDQGAGYLFPQDGKVNILRDTAVPVARINEMLESSKAKREILFLDACRNAPRRGNKGVDWGISFSSNFGKNFPHGRGTITFASCGQGEFSFEMPECRMGVFSHFVVRGLMGEARANRHGLITVDGLRLYVGARVPEWTIAHRRPRQNPWFNGSVGVGVNIPLAVRGIQIEPPPPEQRESIAPQQPAPAASFPLPAHVTYPSQGVAPRVYTSSTLRLVSAGTDQAKLLVIEDGDARTLQGEVRSAMIQAFTDIGIKAREERGELRVGPGLEVKVEAVFRYPRIISYGIEYETLVLKLSAGVTDSKTGGAIASSEHTELKCSTLAENALRNEAKKAIKEFAEKTAKLTAQRIR